MEFIIKSLHITQEDEQKRYNQIERKYSRRFVQLVKRMEKQGYYFENMNIKGCYRFNYAGSTFPLAFKTQKAIYEYVKEIGG
jgi:hypothetical protein